MRLQQRFTATRRHRRRRLRREHSSGSSSSSSEEYESGSPFLSDEEEHGGGEAGPSDEETPEGTTLMQVLVPRSLENLVLVLLESAQEAALSHVARSEQTFFQLDEFWDGQRLPFGTHVVDIITKVRVDQPPGTSDEDKKRRQEENGFMNTVGSMTVAVSDLFPGAMAHQTQPAPAGEDPPPPADGERPLRPISSLMRDLIASDPSIGAAAGAGSAGETARTRLADKWLAQHLQPKLQGYIRNCYAQLAFRDALENPAFYSYMVGPAAKGAAPAVRVPHADAEAPPVDVSTVSAGTGIGHSQFFRLEFQVNLSGWKAHGDGDAVLVSIQGGECGPEGELARALSRLVAVGVTGASAGEKGVPFCGDLPAFFVDLNGERVWDLCGQGERTYRTVGPAKRTRWVRVRQPEHTHLQLSQVAVYARSDLKMNIAKGKPASASDKFSDSVDPSAAVDGALEARNWGSGVWHSSEHDGSAWWKVDLGEAGADVEKVVVYNRKDCCSERLDGAQVELLDQNGNPIESSRLGGDMVQTAEFQKRDESNNASAVYDVSLTVLESNDVLVAVDGKEVSSTWQKAQKLEGMWGFRKFVTGVRIGLCPKGWSFDKPDGNASTAARASGVGLSNVRYRPFFSTSAGKTADEVEAQWEGAPAWDSAETLLDAEKAASKPDSASARLERFLMLQDGVSKPLKLKLEGVKDDGAGALQGYVELLRENAANAGGANRYLGVLLNSQTFRDADFAGLDGAYVERDADGLNHDLSKASDFAQRQFLSEITLFCLKEHRRFLTRLQVAIASAMSHLGGDLDDFGAKTASYEDYVRHQWQVEQKRFLFEKKGEAGAAEAAIMEAWAKAGSEGPPPVRGGILVPKHSGIGEVYLCFAAACVAFPLLAPQFRAAAGQEVPPPPLVRWVQVRQPEDTALALSQVTVLARGAPAGDNWAGKTLYLAAPGSLSFVSYVSGHGGKKWVRTEYSLPEAMPLLLEAHPSKPNAYYLRNVYGTNRSYLSFFDTDNHIFVRANEEKQDQAMPVEFEPVPGTTSYRLVNRYAGDAGDFDGKYVGVRGSRWLAADVDKANAMIFDVKEGLAWGRTCEASSTLENGALVVDGARAATFCTNGAGSWQVDLGEAADVEHVNVEFSESLPNVKNSTSDSFVKLWHAIDTASTTVSATATLELTWIDQGFGRRAGHIYARKDGSDWVNVSTDAAKHTWTRASFDVPAEMLGGKLELGYIVGGGGGHKLTITDAAVKIVDHITNLLLFAKVNAESTKAKKGVTKANKAAGAVPFYYPITSSAIDGLVPESDAVSMRAFGAGQLAGKTWTEVAGWIAPIAPPTHAGSTDPAVAAAFWADFRQVVEMQAVRRNPAAMARDYVAGLPTMFQGHTVARAAAEVEKDCKDDGHSSSSGNRIANPPLGDPLSACKLALPTTARRPLECTVWLTRSRSLRPPSLPRSPD